MLGRELTGILAMTCPVCDNSLLRARMADIFLALWPLELPVEILLHIAEFEPLFALYNASNAHVDVVKRIQSIVAKRTGR